MNLILLSPSDIKDDRHAVLTGRRLKHVREVLKVAKGDRLCVGEEGGLIGEGRVLSVKPHEVELSLELAQTPPPKLLVTLCCALMRPPVLRRVLQAATAMGVERIAIFHSRRVEKSFWQSTALCESDIREQLVLGLEQAKDTVLPEVSFHKRFKPFVEDVLVGWIDDSRKQEVGSRKGQKALALVADPSGDCLRTLRTKDDGRWTTDDAQGASLVPRPSSYVVIIGPEGGFIPYEVDMLRQAGCSVVSLGERVLKVETAVVALLAKLF